MSSSQILPAQVLTEERTNPSQLFAVGLIAGAILALQICIMRIFAVESWVHFGSLVVSLAMLGFGASSVVIYFAKDRFERHWSRAAGISRLPIWSSIGRLQPAGAAGSLQRHLPGLRPNTKMAPLVQLSPLLPAVLLRCAISRDNLPRQAEDIRASLFCGPDWVGSFRIDHPRRDVFSFAGKPSRRAHNALVPRRLPMVRRDKRPARRGGPANTCRGGSRLTAFSSALARHPNARRLPIQGHLLRAELPRRPTDLSKHLAFRRPAGLLELVHAFRARAF